MKIKYFTLLLLFIANLYSYNFTVSSFIDSTDFYSSKTNNITDINGETTGTLTIECIDKDIAFESNLGIVKQVSNLKGYVLYLSPDEKTITIKKIGHLPYEYNISKRIASSCSYFIEIKSDKHILSSIIFESKFPIDVFYKNEKIGTTPFNYKVLSGKRKFTFIAENGESLYSKEIKIKPSNNIYSIKAAMIDISNLDDSHSIALDSNLLQFKKTALNTNNKTIITNIGKHSIAIIHKNVEISRTNIELFRNQIYLLEPVSNYFMILNKLPLFFFKDSTKLENNKKYSITNDIYEFIIKDKCGYEISKKNIKILNESQKNKLFFSKLEIESNIPTTIFIDEKEYESSKINEIYLTPTKHKIVVIETSSSDNIYENTFNFNKDTGHFKLSVKNYSNIGIYQMSTSNYSLIEFITTRSK